MRLNRTDYSDKEIEKTIEAKDEELCTYCNLTPCMAPGVPCDGMECDIAAGNYLDEQKGGVVNESNCQR